MHLIVKASAAFTADLAAFTADLAFPFLFGYPGSLISCSKSHLFEKDSNSFRYELWTVINDNYSRNTISRKMLFHDSNNC